MLELCASISFGLQALSLRLLGSNVPRGDGLDWLIHEGSIYAISGDSDHLKIGLQRARGLQGLKDCHEISWLRTKNIKCTYYIV